MGKAAKHTRRLFRTIIGVVLFAAILLFVTGLVFMIPSVQTKAARKAAAILSEEAGEVVKAVNNIVEKHLDDSDYRTEAIQCGAMCLRFLKNLEKFDWNIKL